MLGTSRASKTSSQTDRYVYEELFKAVRCKLRLIGFEDNDLDDLAQITCLIGHRQNVWMPDDIPGTKRRLVAIARRCAANFRRLYRHSREELLDPSIIDEIPPEGEEVDAEQFMLLRELIAGSARELLVRYHIEGASLADLAAETGVSKSAVQCRLENARERVRQRLLEEENLGER